MNPPPRRRHESACRSRLHRRRPRRGARARRRRRRLGVRALPEALAGGRGPASASPLPRRCHRLRAALLRQPLRLLPRLRRGARLEEYNGHGEGRPGEDGEEVWRGRPQDGEHHRQLLAALSMEWLLQACSRNLIWMFILLRLHIFRLPLEMVH